MRRIIGDVFSSHPPKFIPRLHFGYEALLDFMRERSLDV